MLSNNNVNIVLSLLLNFIKNEINTDEKELTKNTSLQELGLNGLKGIMFIKKYSDEFNVNIDTLNFAHCFTDNTGNLTKKIQPITIDHLEKAIILGRFENEVLKVD